MILCVERRMGNGQSIDCGIFLDQLMLLAREKGLQIVVCGLAVGYADPDEVPNNLITERAPLEDFMRWYTE